MDLQDDSIDIVQRLDYLADADTDEGAPAPVIALTRAAAREIEAQRAKLEQPELISFRDAVVQEALHQRERWGSEHDAGKGPADWIWLVGVLAGRALDHHKDAERLTAALQAASAEMTGGEYARSFVAISHHREKAVHHCITAAAVLANWHAHVLGLHTGMRPGLPAEKQP